MPFSPKTKEDALVACGRHCCICHKFCGIKIEVHHVIPEVDDGDNSFDNAIPLCFDCHADMKSYDHKHPKGSKYSVKELKQHRDNWYRKVDGNIGIANRQEIVETDKRVFQDLVRILPWDGSIDFIRRRNFAGFSFKLDKLDELYDFQYACDNPAFEFVDPDLEGLRSQLLEYILKFNGVVAIETFPTHSPGFNAVPEEWETEQHERFHKVVTLIHETAQNVCETYDALVKNAIRKLGVLPEKNAQHL
ncbi:MAG TPA: HNH endonuclease [Gammaproteobacteria bacterium]|nr:HNH endonuclease [Gammaproteobacteria bacterium]